MTDTMTERSLYASLAAYRLLLGERLVGEQPFLVLECPHEIGHAQRDARRCVTNLLRPTASSRGVELGTLMMVALFHEDPEPSIERTRRWGDLQRQLGELNAYKLYPDRDEHPSLIMNCPYLGSRCPGSEDGGCATNLIPANHDPLDLGAVLQLATEHEKARYGVPISRLTELRRTWAARQHAEIVIRETADGASAGIASARADLIGQLLAELDQAVSGG